MTSTRYLNRKIGFSLLVFALTILIITVVVMSFVPPVSKDALVHHLAIPKLYLKHGGIYEIPFMVFSYYPMNLDLLYMIPLYLGNDIIPKLIHFGFAILTAWMIFSYLKKRAGRVYGLAGVVFFLSIPIIIKLSVTVYVDLGVIFFSFASLLLMMKWLRECFRIKYIVFSGIMCGLALGTKYTSLPTFAILSLFIPFLYSRCGKNKKQLYLKSFLSCIIFVFTALAVFSPWMIRNYVWKENPVYPLYNKFFNPPVQKTPVNIRNDSEKKIQQDRGFFTYRHFIYGESSLEIAILPLRIFFQGKDGNPQYFDGKLNPFLLIFSLLAFLPFKNVSRSLRREKLIMLFFCILYLFIALFTAVLRIRYISPIIPPLTVLSILGIKNLYEALKGAASRFNGVADFIVGILFIFCITLNASYIIKLFARIDPLSYISGRISRDEYISNYIPEYPALKYINENLALDSKVFFVYLGKRGYYCDREYFFNLGLLHRIILRAHNSKELLSRFRKRGITHILVNYPIFDKWVKENCSVDKQEIIKTFFREYTVSAFYQNGIGLNILKKEAR